ncbi:MAG: hypothetical protein AUG06_00175 [Actinobacteria bacterium 13_1_20CM_2_65_11]|nr:MAG: hypothetical protein AUG06_00175 [Actinobacteria bacterium 13_1_20CM_2_65_11]
MRRTRHLYAAARPEEWLGVTVFLLETTVDRVSRRSGEANLRLQGGEYWLATSTGETSALIEVLEGVYEKVPEFHPRHGWNVVDVGANIGAFAVRTAMLGARVYAFEPNPECFRRLKKAATGLNIECFEVAVGAARGRANLASDSARTTKGSLTTDGSGIEVDVERLDQQLPNGIQIDLLKLDVEGSEEAALDGARSVLGAVQRVVLEFHSDDLLQACQDILVTAGLHPMLVDRQPWPNARPGIGNAYFSR